MKVQCSCLGDLVITSIIPMNGQVNFQCKSCETHGFIHQGKIFYQGTEKVCVSCAMYKHDPRTRTNVPCPDCGRS